MTEATSELLRTVPGNPERRGAFIHAGGIDFAMCVPEDAKADLILITEKGKDKETVRIPLTEEMRTSGKYLSPSRGGRISPVTVSPVLRALILICCWET